MGKYNPKKQKEKQPLWVAPVKFATVAVTLAVLALAGLAAVRTFVTFVGGQPVLLTEAGVDLRDSRITVAEYEDLCRQMPGARILWSIPISGQYFDCNAHQIVLERLEEEDIPLFARFEELQSVSALNCTDYAALHKLEQALPGVDVLWQVHMADRAWPRDAELVDLEDANVPLAELEEKLAWFAPGVTVKLGDGSYSDEALEQLKAAFPQLNISWGVNLMGKTYPSSETLLTLAGEAVDVEALIAAADQFLHLQEIDLTGCGLDLDTLTAVQEAYPGVFLRAEFTLHGKTVNTADTEIDLSGIKLKDTLELEQAVRLMPKLTKVDMCDCGFTNEQMDELNQKYENVQFVWIVKFSVYTLRTDATAFCASNLPSHGYIAPKLSSKNLEPLKYCTELIALDLGHMYYKDLSFLENMHKLQYLILVDARYTDIQVISQMKDLYYLELFKNDLDDLTPLLECKNLRHLNIGYTRGFDYTPLKQMTWLERLWFPGHTLTKEEAADLKAALPDTEVYMPNWDTAGSTGGGWRESEVYFEMRNLFDMFYQPGGTGTKKN